MTLEQPKDFKDNYDKFNIGIKKGKILCRTWLLGENGARDKLIAQKKVKVGKRNFEIRGIGLFWINYLELKEEKKFYVYDVSVNNAVGALSFHEYDKEKVYPNQSELMLKDGQVKTFMGKAGIPVMYLLVAMIITGIAVAGLMYSISQLQNYGKQLDTEKAKNTVLTTENGKLKEQLQLYTGAIQ